MEKILQTLRRLLVGPKLSDAADRHDRAADRLDAALREVIDHD